MRKRGTALSNIMDIIAKETNGKSYKTFKYTYEGSDVLSFAYDDHQEITWERYGETVPPNGSINLKRKADSIANDKPLFGFFLDGSRHTYKVDDIAYKNKVYPVIAGQVGVSCCQRIDKVMHSYEFDRRLAIALPKVASQSDWNKKVFFANLCKKLNEESYLETIGIQFTDVIPYATKVDEFDRIEGKGIAVIQDLMIQREVAMVTKLVAEHKINNRRYLLKDGSLEYRVDHLRNDREKRQFQKNFSFVVGVSKSFNPENCKDKKGKNNSNMIADLPLYHRTPVSMYSSPRLEGMRYAVWYLRIRDKRYTTNTFDGILKIEKILVTDEQIHNGLETEEVDLISANIINERNPVCYGADSRWANHLYPVYVTECFAKSKYLNMEKMFEIPVRPVRIAFDHWKLHERYEEAVRTAVRHGHTSLSNYVLYNFEDKPLELYWRLKLNVDLCEELGISIYSFPMKYHPIEDPEYFSNRDYIGLYWNRKFIRTIQAVLNSTKGKVGKGKEFFEKAFGSNDDEFNKLLLMPEAMIIYRFYFEEIGLTDEWWEHYSALTEIQKGIVNPIIYSNIFDEYEETVEDEDCLKVLSYYRIRREDAESAIKGKFS